MPKGHERDSFKTSQNSTTHTQKDTRAVSNTFEILDGHSVKTNPFGSNITGENSYRRAERIGAALHLVTNHVPEHEPLRLIIRTSAIELLAYILELRVSLRSPESEKGQVVLAEVRHLISLVRLLALAGYVSAENVNAISEALDELGTMIVASQRSSLGEQLSITRDDLQPPALQNSTQRTYGTEPNTARIRAAKPIKDIRDRKVSHGVGGGGARAAQIMDILSVGGVLAIKDIAANLPQYSEKMIQRELADLVVSEKISKTGEKRWSRYAINSAV